MSNKLPHNGPNPFADRRNQIPAAQPTADQLKAQQDAAIQQMRLNLSTQFLNTLIPIAAAETIGGSGETFEPVELAINYADRLLIGLGLAHRIETK